MNCPVLLQPLHNMGDSENLEVSEFYRDSTILITGVTGFTGQVLLEKILRRLEPRKIYVLVRRKRDVNARQRVEKLFTNVLFDQVRQDDLPSCIVPVEVDFDQQHFSFDEYIRENLANEVTVVFNLLANVNFNEPIATALQANVEYTKKLLQLVGTFQNLKAFLHVSTFFSNNDRTTIEEIVYPDTNFGGYENVQQILAQLKPAEREALSPLILDKQPNTYTYSKKCAESMINDNFSQLPIGIFRPPIVSSTYREPFPDWYFKYNGPCGVLLALYYGLLTVLPINLEKKVYMAPVDYCINGMLCCAVDVFKKHCQQSENGPGKVQVYNFSDNTKNCRWKEAHRWYVQGMEPFHTYLRARFLTLITVNVFFLEIGFCWMRIRAAIIDCVSWLLQRKSPVTVATRTEQIITQIKHLRPFLIREWEMENRNMVKVIERLSEHDKLRFPCDLRNVDWKSHFNTFVPGILKYVVNNRCEVRKE